MLVILESTTYPGTTEEVLKPILEESGLKCGEDFFLAFSPERVDPGNRTLILKILLKLLVVVHLIAQKLQQHYIETY